MQVSSVGTPPRAIHGPSRLSRQSMPGGPLRRTSTRPPDGAGKSKSKAPEAADRPACLNAGLATDICSLWEPGLPAMQAPRSTRMTKVLPSRASPLPQGGWRYLRFLLLLLPCDCPDDANAPHSGTRRNGETIISVGQKCWICTQLNGFPVVAEERSEAAYPEAVPRGR